MLQIVGFELFYDDELIGINQVIEAINKVSKRTLTFDNVLSLEKKELIEIHPRLPMRCLDEALGIESSPIKISKREALKLLKIANSSQEQKKIPKPLNQNRENKSNSLLLACIDAFKKGNHGDIPSSAAQLLNYCLEHKVQGYEELKKERDRLEWKGDSLSLKYFRGAFRTFKDTKQDV